MTQPVYDFSERVVVVAGGSEGMAHDVAAAFAASGAHVVVCGDKGAAVEGVLYVAAEVTEPAEAERVIAKAVEHFGRVDVVVTSVADEVGTDDDISESFVQGVVDRILLSPLWFAQSAHKVMAVEEDGGCLIHVMGAAVPCPSPAAAAASGARAGLVNLTTTLAMEWAPAVRVNCISVGAATPHDVAQACLYLASEAASAVSGATLALDGGRPAVPAGA